MEKIVGYENLCMGCLTDKGTADTCPHCHFNPEEGAPAGLFLPPYAMLRARYLVGRLLFRGPFSATYLGFDTKTEKRLMIREYMPDQWVRRVAQTGFLSLQVPDAEKYFLFGLHKFVEEGLVLKKVHYTRGMSPVIDVFRENNTAYRVSQIPAVRTLGDDLDERDGQMSFRELIHFFRPMLSTLEQVHSKGLLHFDICPANILMGPDGGGVLTHFCGTDMVMARNHGSVSAILHHGFAPPEFYRKIELSGPRSDVYSLAATMYCALTGITPPPAPKRLSRDNLTAPRELGSEISGHAETALLAGLALNSRDRYPGVKAFHQALLKAWYEADRKRPGAVRDPFIFVDCTYCGLMNEVLETDLKSGTTTCFACERSLGLPPVVDPPTARPSTAQPTEPFARGATGGKFFEVRPSKLYPDDAFVEIRCPTCQALNQILRTDLGTLAQCTVCGSHLSAEDSPPFDINTISLESLISDWEPEPETPPGERHPVADNGQSPDAGTPPAGEEIPEASEPPADEPAEKIPGEDAPATTAAGEADRESGVEAEIEVPEATETVAPPAGDTVPAAAQTGTLPAFAEEDTPEVAAEPEPAAGAGVNAAETMSPAEYTAETGTETAGEADSAPEPGAAEPEIAGADASAREERAAPAEPPHATADWARSGSPEVAPPDEVAAADQLPPGLRPDLPDHSPGEALPHPERPEAQTDETMPETGGEPTVDVAPAAPDDSETAAAAENLSQTEPPGELRAPAELTVSGDVFTPPAGETAAEPAAETGDAEEPFAPLDPSIFDIPDVAPPAEPPAETPPEPDEEALPDFLNFKDISPGEDSAADKPQTAGPPSAAPEPATEREAKGAFDPAAAPPATETDTEKLRPEKSPDTGSRPPANGATAPASPETAKSRDLTPLDCPVCQTRNLFPVSEILQGISCKTCGHVFYETEAAAAAAATAATAVGKSRRQRIWMLAILSVLLVFAAASALYFHQQQTARANQVYAEFLRLGDSFLDQGNYQAAISNYQMALQEKPGDARVAQKIQEARQLLRAGQLSSGTSPGQQRFDELLARADSLMAAGHHARAGEIYQQLLIELPDNAALLEKLTAANRQVAGLSAPDQPGGRVNAAPSPEHVVGTPDLDLHALIARAGPNRTIELERGVYELREPLEISFSLTIKGTGSSFTSIVFSGSGTAITVLPDGALTLEKLGISAKMNLPAGLILVAGGQFDARECEFRRAERDPARGNGGAAIQFAGDSHGTIRQSKFSENRIAVWVDGNAKPAFGENELWQNYTGFRITGSARAVLQNNRIRNHYETAVMMSESAQATLTDNHITENRGNGISVQTEKFSGNFRGNKITGNKGAGVLVAGSAQPILEENEINFNGEGGVFFRESARGILRGNTILRNKFVGVKILDNARPSLQANLIKGNNGDGIEVFDAAQPTLDKNEILDNKGDGISLQLTQNGGLLQNNVCRGNQGYGVSILKAARPKMINNTLTGNYEGDIYEEIPTN